MVKLFSYFYPILSAFTFEVLGTYDHSKGFRSDARTVRVVFAVASILLKPMLSLVLLEYSATTVCWF
jgi:hypothetical protein